jgi:hypothetical protein
MEFNSNITDASRRVYEGRMRLLEETFEAPILEIMRNPARYAERIARVWPELLTRKNMVGLIKTLYRHNKSFRDKEADAFNEWKRVYKEIGREVAAEASTTVRHVVEYQEVAERTKTLPLGSKERVLLSMYSLPEPVRAEYGSIRLFWNAAPQAERDRGLYIVLKDGDEPSHMVFNGRGNQYSRELPQELEKEIIASLTVHPRLHLFENHQGEAFERNVFSNWANRILKRVLKKKTSIGNVRHAPAMPCQPT